MVMSDLAHAEDGVTIKAERLEPDGALVTVSGELDVGTVDPLREALSRALDDGARRVVVDLRGVSFLDSVTVAILVHAARRAGGERRFAVAIEPGSYVRLIFEVAGLVRGLGVFESLDDALAHVA
jgi:anti-sigma B factor antagonist